MRSDPSGEFRQNPCPYCAARPGKPCRNHNGFTFRGLVHRERAHADELAVRRNRKAASE